MAEERIEWKMMTHEHRERSVDWYWVLGLIAFAAAALSVWLGDTLFAGIILIGAGSVGYVVARGPREHDLVIDPRGISIDGTLHSYRAIRSFWVEEYVEEPRLFLTMHSILNQHISFPLENRERAEEVRAFLRSRIHAEHQERHLGEVLAQILGL